jgi:hypothetical protein
MAGYHRVNGRIFRNKNSLRVPDSLSLSLSLVRSTDEGARKKEGRKRKRRRRFAWRVTLAKLPLLPFPSFFFSPLGNLSFFLSPSMIPFKIYENHSKYFGQ